MSRRASLGRDRLLILREFAPSRRQLGILAVAFEQVLPVIRKPLPKPARPGVSKDSDVVKRSYSLASGDRR
jgi:hypothetical protein